MIHNTVYWSAELPAGGYDFAPFYEAIAPVVSQYDIACINQETILVGDPALYANYPNFGSPTQVADALAKTGFPLSPVQRTTALIRARQAFSIPAAIGGSTIRTSQRSAFTIQKKTRKLSA